MLKCVTETEGV
jgi:hypothetical protein